MASTHSFPSVPSRYNANPHQAAADGSDGSNSSVGAAVTRTIAILTKSAAKVHRLSIIRRIQEAGFSVLEERMEEWHDPEDTDFLMEFLACEADERKWIQRLTNGPIYVMVLERRSAAAMWSDLLGPDTKDSATTGTADASVGLRATYGSECFYASPSNLAAERQVSICFPELSDAYEAMDPFEANDTVLVQAADVLYDESGRAFDANNGEELDLQEEIVLASDQIGSQHYGQQQQQQQHGGRAATGQVFRARPLPASLGKPAIQPRMSRAAALRMGIELPAIPRREPSAGMARSLSSSQGGSSGISGLPRSDVVLPKSLAKPTLAPRMNKAVAARLGLSTEESGAAGSVGESPVREKVAVDFSNTPGHKRASSGIRVASLQAPSITPRTNRAAAARMTSGGSSTGAPGLGSTGGWARSAPPPSASSFANRGQGPGMARSTSMTSQDGTLRERKPIDFSNTPGHKRTVSAAERPSSLRAPSVEPRMNKAAAARQGKENSSPTRQRPGTAGNGSCQAAQVPRQRAPVDFSNTPGHRRASLSGSVQLPSLKAPTIAPRLNAAAQARMTARDAAAGSPRSGSALGHHASPSIASMRTGSTAAEANSAGRVTRAPPSAYRHSMIGGIPMRPASRG